jgi:membrane protease YdiL (CAAX protease family)
MNSHNENPNPTEREGGFEPHVDGPSDVPLSVTPRELSPAPTFAPPASDFSSGAGDFTPPTRFVPEDLRVPWGWWDVALLVVIGLVGLLLFGTVFAAALQTAGVSRAQIQHSMVYQGRFAIVAMVFLSFLLLFYLALQMRFRFRSPILRTLRWRPLESGHVRPLLAYLGLISGGFLLSIFVALASSVFTPKNKMPIEQYFQDRPTALLLLIVSVTLAPLFEETIFRGYLYPVVARTFGIVPGVIFTGLLFGLMHASQLGGNLPQVALIMVVGIVFTAARAKTGNVLPGYLLHVSYNSFIAIAFLIASHGLRHMPPA